MIQADVSFPFVLRGNRVPVPMLTAAMIFVHFKRRCFKDKLRVVKGAALLSFAISESSVRHDVAGNPALEKAQGPWPD